MTKDADYFNALAARAFIHGYYDLAERRYRQSAELCETEAGRRVQLEKADEMRKRADERGAA